MESHHGGRIYEYAQDHAVTYSEIEDVSANINPLGQPAQVIIDLQQSLGDIRHYPDHRHTLVKRVLSRRYGVPEEQLFCGNGATEVLDLLLEALRPTRLAILTPAFQGYEHAANRWHIPVVKFPMIWQEQWAIPAESLVKELRNGDCLIINNPHNPTGFAMQTDELTMLFERLMTQGVRVIVDESFMDFLRDQALWSALRKAIVTDSLYVLRSATKMYAIPGLRFGFAVGNANVFARIENGRDGWSVNQLAQRAAVIAYQEPEFDQRTWQWLDEELCWLQTTWGQHPMISMQSPHANFFLIRLPTADIARTLWQTLADQRIYLRGMQGFAPLDDHYLRIAIKTRDKNAMLWHALTEFSAHA